MDAAASDSLFARLAPLLRLTRVSTAFAAVGNIWFVVLWTRAIPEERNAAAAHPETAPIVTPGLPLLQLAAATLVALGLFAFATVINDTLDRKRDRALHPDRPIPSGAVSLEFAVALVALALLTAFLGATLLGTAAVALTLATTTAILLFHGALKHIPSLGLVLLSLIYAAHMLIGNAALIFVWPVWLAMTHALAAGAITHTLARRRPTLRKLPVAIAVLGWAFWSAALFTTAQLRHGTIWPEFVPPRAAVVPAILFAAFFFFLRIKIRNARSPDVAADKVHRYAALWMPLYAVAWCLGTMGESPSAELLPASIALGVLAAAGALGMTLLRELYSLAEHPIGFRR